MEQEFGPREFADAEREEDRLEVERRLADLRAAEPVAVAVVAEEDTFFWKTTFSSDDED